MQISIIGAGSIGLLFAAKLSAFCHVNLYCRTNKQAMEINNNGLEFTQGLQSQKLSVEAFTMDDWVGAEELTIIAVKQYQLQPVLDTINSFHKKLENLLFLQNGMSHIRQIENVKAENIFIGSVEHGALKLGPRTVSFNGEGVTNIALFKGNMAFMERFCTAVQTVFPFVFKPDYYQMLINKLIINACINPLTAILQVNNGELIKNQYFYTAMSDLFTEISTILDLQNPEGYWQQIYTVCQKTASNRSSMLKDIEAKRQTEIDAILGFLLDEAELKGKQAPLIKGLYSLVKGKELSGGAFV